MKRHKGGAKGLRPLKKRRKPHQLDNKAARQQQRKDRKKVVPGNGD